MNQTSLESSLSDSCRDGSFRLVNYSSRLDLSFELANQAKLELAFLQSIVFQIYEPFFVTRHVAWIFWASAYQQVVHMLGLVESLYQMKLSN
jgi:hypothetical protein